MRLNADLLIVTATRVEMDAVLTEFPKRQDIHLPKQSYSDLGEIEGMRLVAVQGGMGSEGPDDIRRAVRFGIEELKPKCIVMPGIAFGVNPKRQQLSDILISEQVVQYEKVKIGTGADGTVKLVRRGDKITVSPQLLSRVRNALDTWRGDRVTFGLLLSGEKLIDNRDYRDELLADFPEAIGGEMEATGLYVEASEHGVPWIVIKAICDWADGNKNEDKGARQTRAAAASVRFLRHLIRDRRLIPGDDASSSPSPALVAEHPSGTTDVVEEIRDIAKRAAERIAGVPGVVAVVPIGSHGAEVDIARLHGAAVVLDLDFLVLVNAVNRETVKLLRQELTYVVDRSRRTGITVEFALINGPYKPEPVSGVSVLLHILLHDVAEFERDQPRIFLYSWHDSVATYGSYSIAELYRRKYNDVPPSLRDVVKEPFGIEDSIRVLRGVEESGFLTVPEWSDFVAGPRLADRRLPVVKHRRADLASYFIIWAACNVLRAIERQPIVPSDVVLQKFEEHFKAKLGPLAALPQQAFASKYLSGDYVISTGDAITFLRELRTFCVTGSSREELISVRNRVETTVAHDSVAIVSTCEALYTARKIERREHAPDFYILHPEIAPAFGFDLRSEALDQLVAVLSDDIESVFARMLRHLVMRRAFYYLAKVLEVRFLHPDLANAKWHGVVASMRNLCEPYIRSIEMISTPTESALAGVAETTIDSRLFTILRLLQIRESDDSDGLDSVVRIVIEYLLEDAVGEQGDIKAEDESNVWWAFALLLRHRSTHDLRCTVSDVEWDRLYSALSALVVKDEAHVRVPLESETRREITPEILVPERTASYSVVNLLALTAYVPNLSFQLWKRAMYLWTSIVEKSARGPNIYLSAVRLQAGRALTDAIRGALAEV